MANIKRINIEPWIRAKLSRSPQSSSDCGLKPIASLPLEFGVHRPIDGVYLRHDWMTCDGYSLWSLWTGDQIRDLRRRSKLTETRLYLAIVVYGDRQFVTTMERDFQPIEPCPPRWEIEACLRVRQRLTRRDRQWVEYWQGFRSDLALRLYRWKYYKGLWGHDRAYQVRKWRYNGGNIDRVGGLPGVPDLALN